MNIGSIIATIKADISNFETGMGKVKDLGQKVATSVETGLNKAFQEASTLVKDFGNYVKKAMVVVGAAFAGAVYMAQDAVSAYDETRKSLITLGIISERFGQDEDKATEAARQLGKELKIGVGASANSLQNLLKSGLNLDQATDLMKRFTNEAITGKSANITLAEAVENLSFAYATGNSAIGNLSGISENFNDIIERGATLMKKKTSEMSEAELQEAKYRGMLELTELTLGSSEKLTGTYSDKVANLNLKFIDLKEYIGSQLEPIFSNLIDQFVKLWDKTNILYEELRDKFAPKIEDVKKVYSELADKIIEKFPTWDDFATKVEKIVENLLNFSEWFGNLVKDHPKWFEAIVKVASGFVVFSKAVSMTPIGLLLTLTGIFITMVALNWDNFKATWDWFKNSFASGDWWQSLKDNLSAVADLIERILKNVPFFAGIVDTTSAIRKALTNNESSYFAPSGDKNTTEKLTFSSPTSQFSTGKTYLGSLPKNANGTNYWKGGFTEINERGHEFIDLPRGSRITPNDKLGNNITINLDGATISSQQDAMQYAEQIGDAILEKLTMSRRAYGI